MSNLRAASCAAQRWLDQTRSWYCVERAVGLIGDRFVLFFLWMVVSPFIGGDTVSRLQQASLWHLGALADKIPFWLVLGPAFLLGLPVVAWMAVIAVYSVGFLAVYGQTPGMAGARMRVITNNGRKPGLGRVLARHVLSYISFLALGFGYAWSLIDSQGRTWHDILSGTKVVRYPRQRAS